MAGITTEALQVVDIACIGELVEVDDELIGLGQPVEHEVAANKACTARYKDAHTRPPAWATESMATALCVFISEPESLPAKHTKSLPVATFLS